MKKAVFIIIIITILSKIIGFTRDIVLAYYYGISNISDAFLISLTIPTVIFSFIGVGISTVYIPMYSKIEQSCGEKEAHRYTNNLINISLVICTAIIILGLLFTDHIIKVFASGFYGETLILAVRFTRVSLLSIYFIGIIYIFQSFLQLKGKFAIPALIGLPLNTIILLSIILSSRTDIIVLSIGSVVATASQLVFLIPLVYKKGYRYKFTLNLKDKNIIDMFYVAIPVIIWVSVNQINVLVDKTLASRIATGGISALTYANRLNGFVVSIFVLSISTVLYPKISKMAAAKDVNGLKKAISNAINSISLLLVPATIGAIIFAEPIVKLLFARGAFDTSAVILTSDALLFYSIGMIGFGFREIIAKGFYSLQDTKTPMINAAIMMIINIILNLILSRYIGIGGLALASSISGLWGMLLLFISLRNKIGKFGMGDIGVTFIKILFASLLMGLIAKLSYNYLILLINKNLSLVFSIGVGIITYFIIIYFMNIEDVNIIVKVIKRKLKIA